MPGEETFNLNLGEMELDTLPSYEAAEKFLSAESSDIQDINEEDTNKPDPKKTAVKKPDEKKVEEDKETEEQIAAKAKLQKIKTDPLGEIDEDEDLTDEAKAAKEKEEGTVKKEELDEEGNLKTSKEPELNQFEAFSKDLIKIGAFSDLLEGEQLPKNPEEFLKRWNEDRQRGAVQWLDDFLTRHGEDKKEIFESIFINGVDPKEYLSAYTELQTFENVDVENEDNQKAVFREFYRRLGWDEPDIDKKLQKTVDYGDLAVDSKKFHEQIVKQDKQRLEDINNQALQQQENQRHIDEQYRTSLQTSLNNALKAKEINGIPVTEPVARKAFDFLSTKKYKLPDGQLLTEFDKFVLESKKPENIQQRLIIALLAQDNFTFNNIKKKALSEETNSIFETVQRKGIKKNRETTKTTPAASKSNTWFSL